MGEYLLVDTEGTWAGPGCERFVEDGCGLAKAGHMVTLFLVENGITAAVAAASSAVAGLVSLGGRVWVDRFSLAQRGFTPEDLAPCVEPVAMDLVAQRLLEPTVQVVWH